MTEYVFPLSFAQERLWFLQQLDPQAPTFNISMVLRLNGSLDESALAGALDLVVSRHDALRTRFAVIDGQLCQVVRDPGPVPIDSIDLRTLAVGERDSETDRVIEAECRRPFDLAAEAHPGHPGPVH